LEKGAFFLDRAGGKRQYQWRLSYRKTPVKSLAKSFPKLLRRIRDPETKVVLSLGAGGLRLFAHASIMKFIDTIGARDQIDEIWGCSGGAIAGLVYSMHVPPERMEQVGYDAYNRRFRVTLTPSLLGVTRNLILDTFLPASPELVKGFVSVQQTMQMMLARLTEKRKAEIPFYCLAYNVKRQQTQVLTPFPVNKRFYKDMIVRANPIDAIVASSSIPFMYTPKVIRRGKNEEHYIDGATIEEVPMASIYRKWILDHRYGLEKRSKLLILAVDLFPRLAQRWLDYPLVNRVPLVDFINFGLRLIDLVRRARIQDQTEALRMNKNARVLQITLPLKTLSVLNTRDIPVIIKSAQTSFLEQMLEIEKSL
jgi:predicted acylesterase/phospholipase RssA